MANYFWVGGTGTYDGTTNHFATSSGGVATVAAPTSADNVTFDTLSNAVAYTVTVSATLSCANLVIGPPVSGNVTWAGASGISIFGNFTTGTGVTRTYTGTLTFAATSTGKTITMGGVVLAGPVTFDGVGGGWTLQDALNPSGFNITLTNGALDTNGKTVGSTNISSSNSNVRSLTLGTSTLNINAWNTTINTNLTFSGASSTINVTNSNGNILGPAAATGLTFGTVNVSLVGTWTTSGQNTFGTLTITKTAATDAATWSLSDNQTITGTLTINGANADLRRVIIQSGTYETAKTISAGTVTMTNVDLRDITGTGAGNWNLSAITGGSGNCGGCTGITFTTGANQFYQTAVSSLYSDVTKWFLTTNGGGGAGRVPLPQDSAFFDANSVTAAGVTLTFDMIRCGDIDFTGIANTPTITSGTVANNFYGNLILVSGVTFSFDTTIRQFRNYKNVTLTSGGKTWLNTWNMFPKTGSTISLGDDLTMSGTSPNAIYSMRTGNFNANNKNVTAAAFNFQFQAVRVLTMGSGTWTLNGVNGSGNTWDMTGQTGMTVNANTSTLVLSDATATAKGFVGGNFTYNNVTFSGDNITVSSSNTFNTLAVNNAGLTNGLKFTVSTTQTVTGFTTNGFAANLAKILSTSAGTSFTLSKPGGGQVSVDYMSIKDSTTDSLASWFAGANSSNVSGNTIWRFTAPTIKSVSGTTMANIKNVSGLLQGSLKAISGITL